MCVCVCVCPPVSQCHVKSGFSGDLFLQESMSVLPSSTLIDALVDGNVFSPVPVLLCIPLCVSVRVCGCECIPYTTLSTLMPGFPHVFSLVCGSFPAVQTNSLITGNGCTRFAELPLSQRTLRALQENGYTEMTMVQQASLPHALKGRDILGAAKTGSGKTLSFVIPVWHTPTLIGVFMISETGA